MDLVASIQFALLLGRSVPAFRSQLQGAIAGRLQSCGGRSPLRIPEDDASDGRVIHPMYLFEVKKPEESKYPYDYYRLISARHLA